MIKPHELKSIIETVRHPPYRTYDQIPMITSHLLAQAHAVVHTMVNKKIVFVGDYDCASLALLGTAITLDLPIPTITVLDFDQRVLDSVARGARMLGAETELSIETYNVFDLLPQHLTEKFDWFYTNPPFGAYNKGASVNLFVHRGIELCKHTEAGGTLIVPADVNRPWSIQALKSVREFLFQAGWRMAEIGHVHHNYHLDDDPDLQSSSLTLIRDTHPVPICPLLPYKGRCVDHHSIPTFY